MTIAESLWISGALLGVLAAVIGVVWSLLLGKIEALERSLADLHAKHDASHERLAKVEVEAKHSADKVSEVDSRRHRYQTFNDEAMRDMHKWINEKLIEALKE